MRPPCHKRKDIPICSMVFINTSSSLTWRLPDEFHSKVLSLLGVLLCYLFRLALWLLLIEPWEFIKLATLDKVNLSAFLASWTDILGISAISSSTLLSCEWRYLLVINPHLVFSWYPPALVYWITRQKTRLCSLVNRCCLGINSVTIALWGCILFAGIEVILRRRSVLALLRSATRCSIAVRIRAAVSSSSSAFNLESLYTIS